VLSKEEQLAQKTVSADVARYVLSNTKMTFKWSELPDSTKETYGDAAEIVEDGEALFSTSNHYFSHHLTRNTKSTVYITPRVVETGDKYKLALEVVTFKNGDSMQVLRVDEGLDGTVDKAFQAEGSGSLKPPYERRENELDDFIFDFNLKVYRKKVIDKEQH